jgi:hypothetical protein
MLLGQQRKERALAVFVYKCHVQIAVLALDQPVSISCLISTRNSKTSEIRMASIVTEILSRMIPDLSGLLTSNFPDLQTSTPGSTQARADLTIEKSELYRSSVDENPLLQSFTGMPYTMEEISLGDVPEQTVEVCKIVEESALEDLLLEDAAASGIEIYRTHLLQQILDLCNSHQKSDPTWKEFFEYSLRRNRRTADGNPVIPEAILEDVEQKAGLPRVGQALRVHLRATRDLTDEQLNGVWSNPQYNEEMRYLQRASQVLRSFCVYHTTNTPGKFLEPVPAGWLTEKSA